MEGKYKKYIETLLEAREFQNSKQMEDGSYSPDIKNSCSGTDIHKVLMDIKKSSEKKLTLQDLIEKLKERDDDDNKENIPGLLEYLKDKRNEIRDSKRYNYVKKLLTNFFNDINNKYSYNFTNLSRILIGYNYSQFYNVGTEADIKKLENALKSQKGRLAKKDIRSVLNSEEKTYDEALWFIDFFRERSDNKKDTKSILRKEVHNDNSLEGNLTKLFGIQIIEKVFDKDPKNDFLDNFPKKFFSFSIKDQGKTFNFSDVKEYLNKKLSNISYKPTGTSSTIPEDVQTYSMLKKLVIEYLLDDDFENNEEKINLVTSFVALYKKVCHATPEETYDKIKEFIKKPDDNSNKKISNKNLSILEKIVNETGTEKLIQEVPLEKSDPEMENKNKSNASKRDDKLQVKKDEKGKFIIIINGNNLTMGKDHSNDKPEDADNIVYTSSEHYGGPKNNIPSSDLLLILPTPENKEVNLFISKKYNNVNRNTLTEVRNVINQKYHFAELDGKKWWGRYRIYKDMTVHFFDQKSQKRNDYYNQDIKDMTFPPVNIKYYKNNTIKIPKVFDDYTLSSIIKIIATNINNTLVVDASKTPFTSKKSIYTEEDQNILQFTNNVWLKFISSVRIITKYLSSKSGRNSEEAIRKNIKDIEEKIESIEKKVEQKSNKNNVISPNWGEIQNKKSASVRTFDDVKKLDRKTLKARANNIRDRK